VHDCELQRISVSVRCLTKRRELVTDTFSAIIFAPSRAASPHALKYALLDEAHGLSSICENGVHDPDEQVRNGRRAPFARRKRGHGRGFLNTYGDIKDGVIWNAAMHRTISRGYRNSALENSSSEANKRLTACLHGGKVIEAVYQELHRKT
jgi:hypothetical protein